MAPAMGGSVGDPIGDDNLAVIYGSKGNGWPPATSATVTGDYGQTYTTVLTSKFIPTRSSACLDTDVSTETWVDVCETGYTTKTATVTTTHCGCTETPAPTIPMKTITTTCPEGWAITDPVTLTVPWTDDYDDWTTTSTATPTTNTWTWTTATWTTAAWTNPVTSTAWPASTPTYGAWATATQTSATTYSTWSADPTSPWIATYTGGAARLGVGITWFVAAVVAGGVALFAI